MVTSIVEKSYDLSEGGWKTCLYTLQSYYHHHYHGGGPDHHHQKVILNAA